MKFRLKLTPKNITWVFFAIAFVLGLVETWASRHEMNGDGIPYLDIGDAYFRADWSAAINASWSPLYKLCDLYRCLLQFLVLPEAGYRTSRGTTGKTRWGATASKDDSAYSRIH